MNSRLGVAKGAFEMPGTIDDRRDEVGQLFGGGDAILKLVQGQLSLDLMPVEELPQLLSVSGGYFVKSM